jgi:hypothetical protein
MTQFELTMLGGPVTARLRRRRPGLDDLPWGSLDPSEFTPEALHEARALWTNATFTEYASAAAFSALTSALLECGAPIDLSALAADSAVDELDHAEVLSRLVTELGGAAAFEVELGLVSPSTTPGVSPLLRAAELAIKTSCVGEALSVPALLRSRQLAGNALVRAVLDRLLRDEGQHARIGIWFLESANERLSRADREHLARVTLDAIAVYRPLWQGRCVACAAPAALGGVPADDHAALMVSAVRTRIVRPLRRLGIAIEGDALESLLE